MASTLPANFDALFTLYRSFPEDKKRYAEFAKEPRAMPVLALGGEFSGSGFPFASLARLAHNVWGAIIPGCGHYLAEEGPEDVTAHLLALFAEA